MSLMSMHTQTFTDRLSPSAFQKVVIKAYLDSNINTRPNLTHYQGLIVECLGSASHLARELTLKITLTTITGEPIKMIDCGLGLIRLSNVITLHQHAQALYG